MLVKFIARSVADPGFPVGWGANPSGKDTNAQHGDVKIREIQIFGGSDGPISRSANVCLLASHLNKSFVMV